MPEFPDRPSPPVSLAARVRAWIEWVGLGRVVASSVVVVAVVAGAYWLVKPPPATTESKLPYAGSSVTASTTTAPTSVVASSTTVASAEMVVHVAGAVLSPGVYRMGAGTRVVDAVQAAGGVAADANSDAINLAAPLIDGERVYIPRVGEVAPAVATNGVDSTTGSTTSGPVNLNTATADDLDSLPGVGPATATAILVYREQHGPFASVEDLADVRGIGPTKLDALRGLVTV